MSETNLDEIRRKNSEEKSEEVEMFSQMMQIYADRDSFPSTKLRKVMGVDHQVVGYAFDFANPWYVAEPLSTVQNISIRINGEDVNRNDISMIVRDQKIPIEVAKTIYEIWWGFGEVIQILIENRAMKADILRRENDLDMRLDMRTTLNYGIPGNVVHYVFNRRMEVQ